LSTGLKANNDGSAAIQVGGTDYIEIGSTGNITMPGNLTVTGTFTAGGGLVYDLNMYVAPATWTKPTGLKAIKVTVVGAGGNSGTHPAPIITSTSGGGSGGAAILVIPAPSIPGPVAVTAGSGTNSFGAFASATAGSDGSAVNAGGVAGGAGGLGTGGSINIDGNRGNSAVWVGAPGSFVIQAGGGAPSILGIGGASQWSPSAVVALNGVPGTGYGSGGGGGVRSPASLPTPGTGAPGIVIVEEFY
jgi:hypothetical protein